jgi:hypothetical protein
MIHPVFKKYDEGLMEEMIDNMDGDIDNYKDHIKALKKELQEKQESIQKDIEMYLKNIADNRHSIKTFTRIININNAIDISNTKLELLPYELYRSITDKNLFHEIKNFDKRKLKGNAFYRSNCKDYSELGYRTNSVRFNPAVEFAIVSAPNSKTRRGIFIHGREEMYLKGALINYLEQNGIKGYKSWTFKKLYDTCYSF